MRSIFTIAKREWKSQLVNPAFYVVLVVFLLLWMWLFFRNAFLVGEASVRIMFDLLPWLSLILVPAVTMGSIAGEKESGTLEMVLTQPITTWQFVIGKFLGVMALPTVAVMFSLPVAIGMGALGWIDFGVVAGQIMGGIALASVLGSLGLWLSAKLSNQVAALLVAVVGGFLLIVGGSDFVTSSLPLQAVRITEALGVTTHLDGFNKGVIEIRDVWYFVSTVTVFLALTWLSLSENKFGKKVDKRLGVNALAAMIVGVAIVTNVLGSQLGFRWDLTANKSFTLSPLTRESVGKLPDKARVTLFVSQNLPAQYLPIERFAKDLLSDFQSVAKGKIEFSINKSQTDAQGAGIKEVQFNVISQEEFQVKSGFLGIKVEYKDKTETIPFVQTVGDLEYQLTSMLVKLSSEEKKKVLFTQDNSEKSLFGDLTIINTELSKQFETAIYEKESDATDAAALVIAGPVGNPDAKLVTSIKKLVESGVGLVMLLDGQKVTPGLFTSEPNKDNFNQLAKLFGLQVEEGAVYDLQANEVVRFGGDQPGSAYLLPYPFWVRAGSTKLNSTVVVPWGSRVNVDDVEVGNAGYKALSIFETTDYAGNKTGSFSINPDEKTFSTEGLGKKILGVELTPSGGAGKVVLVGNSSWVTDQFVQNTPENLTVFMEIVSGVTNQKSLASIKAKSLSNGKIVAGSSVMLNIVKWGSMSVAVLLPTVVGVIVFSKRRRNRLRYYLHQNQSV